MNKTQEYYEKLGWALKSQRKVKKICIEEIAEKLEVTAQQISKYELGRNRIPADKLNEYCKIIGIKLIWITELLDKNLSE